MASNPLKASFPVFNGFAPMEGPKALPIEFDFSASTEKTIDLYAENAGGVLQFVQSVWVENQRNPNPLYLTFQSTGQIIEIPEYTQGVWPVFTTDQVQVKLSSVQNLNAIGKVILLNTPMAPFQSSTVCCGETPPVAYEGMVASRMYIPDTILGTAQQMMTRTRHLANDDITALKIAVPNWAVVGGAEVGTGNVLTVKASIEYPAGVLTQVLFGGATFGTAANLTTLFSDYMPVTIAKGDWFYIRMYLENPVAIPILVGGQVMIDIPNGETLNYGPAGIPNECLTPTTTQGPNTFDNLWPVGIIGVTTAPSVYLLGDSRTLGFGDSVDGSGFTGNLSRGISPVIASVNGGVSGQSAQNWIVKQALQEELINYCSSVILELGFNDFASGRSATQVIAYRNAIETRLSLLGVQIIQTTCEPKSTSTDGFITAVNQTTAAFNAQLVLFNTAVRTKATFIDTSYWIENSLNDGKWICTGATARTTDGIHENTLGYYNANTAAIPSIITPRT